MPLTLTLTLILCPLYTGPSLPSARSPALQGPQMGSQNRAQLAARAGRSSSGHEDSLVTSSLTPDNPRKPTLNMDLGWAELTDIRVFVGLDDLRQFKVPCDYGHLGWEDGEGSWGSCLWGLVAPGSDPAPA